MIHIPTPTEHAEQVSLFGWAKLKRAELPELALFFAIPNGGDRHAAVGRQMKAEGVRAGVPDTFLPVARGGFHGLYIELKAQDRRPKRGGKGGVSEAQQEWIEALRNQGFRVEVCYGWREAAAVIEDYLRKENEQ